MLILIPVRIVSQKNFAPRVPGIEQFGILDGSEKMSTTTGTKIVNNYVEKRQG